jgi:hypothetical protein
MIRAVAAVQRVCGPRAQPARNSTASTTSSHSQAAPATHDTVRVAICTSPEHSSSSYGVQGGGSAACHQQQPQNQEMSITVQEAVSGGFLRQPSHAFSLVSSLRRSMSRRRQDRQYSPPKPGTRAARVHTLRSLLTPAAQHRSEPLRLTVCLTGNKASHLSLLVGAPTPPAPVAPEQPSLQYKIAAIQRGRKDELMNQWCQGVTDMAVTLQRWSHFASPWKRYSCIGAGVPDRDLQQEPEQELRVSDDHH